MKQMIQYYNPRGGVLRIGLGYKAGVSHNSRHFSDLGLHVVRHLIFFVRGIVHNLFVYRSNLIFWIVMGCGIADFCRRGL